MAVSAGFFLDEDDEEEDVDFLGEIRLGKPRKMRMCMKCFGRCKKKCNNKAKDR